MGDIIIMGIMMCLSCSSVSHSPAPAVPSDRVRTAPYAAHWSRAFTWVSSLRYLRLLHRFMQVHFGFNERRHCHVMFNDRRRREGNRSTILDVGVDDRRERVAAPSSTGGCQRKAAPLNLAVSSTGRFALRSRTDVTPRTRKTVAVLCIALVLVAGILPVVSAALGAVILVALWLVAPLAAVAVVQRIASASKEQPVSLLGLLDPRGPPCLIAFA